MADLNQKLCELKYGALDSSEGAWATISRHLQVVADFSYGIISRNTNSPMRTVAKQI
jgi:hypothetical protein